VSKSARCCSFLFLMSAWRLRAARTVFDGVPMRSECWSDVKEVDGERAK
jgi:hypothetical protein